MNNFKIEMLNKIHAGEELTEEELQELIWSSCIDTIEGDEHRWYREMQTIIRLKDEYFAIDWQKGLTEMQENEFCEQPYPVKPIAKVITITEWVPIDEQ